MANSWRKLLLKALEEAEAEEALGLAGIVDGPL